MENQTIDTAPANLLQNAELPAGFPVNLEEEILRLKQDLHAVILAHYYQDSEIQDLADFVGDSLDLSRRAASTDAETIVFAGVHFMAETAKILSPSKQVLLPDLKAGCSLAEGCPAPLFKEFRERHPGHVAISYINCSAEVKALSDIICTSSNAEKIIRQIPENRPVLRNLPDDLLRIARGANDVAEGLDLRAAIDIADCNMARVPLPEFLEQGGRAPFCERAPRFQIGQEHLFGGAQDFRRLSHEMNPGKNDGLRIRRCRPAGEVKAVPYKIGQVLDLGILVIVREDHCMQVLLEPEDLLLQIYRESCRKFGILKQIRRGRIDRLILHSF